MYDVKIASMFKDTSLINCLLVLRPINVLILKINLKTLLM